MGASFNRIKFVFLKEEKLPCGFLDGLDKGPAAGNIKTGD
jgi:hypothetical protein